MARGRSRAAGAIVFVILAIELQVSARFVVQKGSVNVLSPESIRSTHDGAIANFGVPDYGATLVGVVVYPDAGANGCTAFTKKFRSQSARPVILLLDRGECYLAKKVWHGQLAGVAAVLIVDNQDEPLITLDTPEATANKDNYVKDIVIPSAVITLSLSETLKQTLADESSNKVVVKLDWTESMSHLLRNNNDQWIDPWHPTHGRLSAW